LDSSHITSVRLKSAVLGNALYLLFHCKTGCDE